MSLAGIQPKQKIPGAVVEDLRNYASALGLPHDWHEFVTVKTSTSLSESKWFVEYNGKALATYELDLLHKIKDAKHHVPIPPPVDPLVVASELAVLQPTDLRFRRFNDCIFRVDEIAAVDGKLIKDGKMRFRVILKNGKEFEGENEKNYANSGMSTFEFFIEHVLGLTPISREPNR